MTVYRNPNSTKSARAVATLAGWALITASIALPGCSVALEASRPPSTDLTRYQPGEARDYVIGRLGQPQSSAQAPDGNACDSYTLYTGGASDSEKSSTEAIEGAAAVLSLGISEIIATPLELAMRPKPHSVSFCYAAGKLAQLTDDGQVIAAYSPAAISAPASVTQDAPTPTPTGPQAAESTGANALPSATQANSK